MKLELKGRTLKRQDPESSNRISFMADDIFGLVDVDKIFLIESIYISPAYRRRGIASALLQEVIKKHKSKIICCSAPISSTGIKYFLTERGFVSINDYVEYEGKDSFVYHSEASEELLEKLHERMKKQ